MVAWAERNVKIPWLKRAVALYWPAGAFSFSLLFALLGQALTSGRQYPRYGALAFGLATLLFLWPLVRSNGVVLEDGHTRELTAGSAPRPLIRPVAIQALLVALSLFFAGLAYVGFSGNQLDRGLLPWLAALLFFLLAFGQHPAGRRSWQIDRRTALALLAITGLAVFFRAYRLDAVPIEMTSDHAEKLLDVNDVLNNGMRPIFFGRNTGREFFQFYLTAALVWLTPLTIGHLALKVGTALVGIATVPLTYLLARQEYGRLVGLLAAFFLAVSHWHVAITRVGLRFPFTAAFAIPALFFLLRAMRHNQRNDWLAAGLVLGLGLHTYTAMRIVPVLFVALVGLKAGLDVWAAWRGRTAGDNEVSALQPDFWLNALLGAAAALLVFLPLLRYLVEFPNSFWYRAASRSVEGVETDYVALWHTFWGNVKNALLMFNYRGDVVPINTIPESAVLGLVSGALFVPGLAYVLVRLLRHRQRRDLYLLVSLGFLLLPSILSLAFPGENPSVVRTGGAVPLVMIIVALPLAAILKSLWAMQRPGQVLALSLLLFLLPWAVVDNYRWYFIDYDEHTRRSLWNTTEMAEVVREFLAAGGDMAAVYHISYPHWVDTRNIGINAGYPTWENNIANLSQLAILPAGDPHQPRLYLVHLEDGNAQWALEEVFPAGEWERYDSAREGKDFLIYRVPAGP